MSANPNSAGLELVAAADSVSERKAAVSPYESRHEALQALLAFSSLHEHIRQRRAQEQLHGASEYSDSWQLEQFVLDEVLQLVAERALAITGAEGVAIALAEGNAIVCRAAAGSIAPDVGATLDPKSGFSGACLVSGQIVRCDDPENDPRVDLQACRRLGTRSMVAVPLSAKQTVVGLLEAFSSEAYGFNDSDVRSLNLLAELILSALRPEEENRLAEISQRVVPPAPVVEAVPIEMAPAPSPHSEEPSITEVSEPSPARPVPAAATQPEKIGWPGLSVVVAVVMFAAGLGAGLWWMIRQHPTASVAKPRQSEVLVTQQPPPPPAQNAAPPVTAQDIDLPMPATAEEAGVLPEVTGIRHWSSADASTVVVDLQDQVQYEAHRLQNPERIYFDLHDTKLVSALSGKTIVVDDALIQQVRVAQPIAGVTRVVLQTKAASDFSVSLEANPYRLVIEVRKLGSPAQPRVRVNLFSSPSETAAQAAADPKDLVSDASKAPSNLPKFRIALDAGHGGWDLGTVGRKGLLEKDLVLDIVKRLGNLIERRTRDQVIYTRTDDSYLALEKRAEIANLARADLFLSIHANYSDFASARGVETYYSNTYSSIRARTGDDAGKPELQNVNWTHVDIRERVHESRRFAASVQHSLYGTLAEKNRGLRNRGVKQAGYVVLTGTSMPAILAEVSFVSSPDDESNLQSSTYRQRIAEALYQGLARYTAESDGMKARENTVALAKH